jgi:hypothetical protein
MVSSTLQLSWSVIYGTLISVAQIVCCDSDSKAWELLLSLIVQYLFTCRSFMSTYMSHIYMAYLCSVARESKRNCICMNSKILREKGQGNIEALELVSLPP